MPYESDGAPDRVSTSPPGILAVVVIFESAAVIDRCLDSLLEAAPQRGIEVRVVDNGSSDDGAARASARLGERAVIRMPVNRGFAAGVNAGLANAGSDWLAVVNPDLCFAPGALDALAAFLEGHPRAGVAGPRVDDAEGRREETAGVFPSSRREWVHAWMLDRVLPVQGRHRVQPMSAERVDWISGCAWLLRRAAWEAVGSLDEGYFMYFEDVDYCRRMAESGWEVWSNPAVRATHARGTGSRATATLPADGGAAAVRYLRKHLRPADRAPSVAALRSGWALRLAVRRGLAALGHPASRAIAERFRLALETSSRTK